MARESADLLRQCTDLRALPDAALASLAERAHRLRKSRGELIWRYRDPVESVFVLLEGVAHVQMSGPDGDLILTGLVLPGHLIGEAEVFTDERHRFNQVLAAESCTLIALPMAPFLELVETYSDFARHWLRVANQKFIGSLRHIYGVKVGSARARLARMLLLLDHWHQGTGDHDMALSQETIGHYVGLSRQVVNTILNEWKKQALIRTGYGRVGILDREALARTADDLL